eukprot:CAMPEP_0204282726 /NCGR_PEP_ID=MMETSP0468-20130131/44277_1 /ASSEMBLY_ACC=CAM_ASM_000383 /TAXON_ID=2969 /ORGANISM="Oxyrrhis marina" /LENGTH=80 /DNA_ID=CAMNT_0051260265 /DNA_START=119 /DNA_END=357 /DNA_ORIENTATION=+
MKCVNQPLEAIRPRFNQIHDIESGTFMHNRGVTSPLGKLAVCDDFIAVSIHGCEGKLFIGQRSVPDVLQHFGEFATGQFA